MHCRRSHASRPPFSRKSRVHPGMTMQYGITLAPGLGVDVVEHTSHARGRDGDQKEVRAQIRKSEVRPRSEQERRECDASPEEGDVEERARWQGRHGEEPEAGHCHRAVRSAKEGSEGSAEERIPEEQLAQEFLAQELPEGRVEEELEKAVVVAAGRATIDAARLCAVHTAGRRSRSCSTLLVRRPTRAAA